jgi:hypothetical protein
MTIRMGEMVEIISASCLCSGYPSTVYGTFVEV